MRRYRDIYCIGDLHGDWQGLESVIYQMVADGFNPVDDLLVQLGDLVDGFPNSKEVVSYFKRLNEKYPENVIVLKGNHDELTIHGVDAHVGSDQFEVWWQQGGQQTWESYWMDGYEKHVDPYGVYVGRPYLTVPDLMHEHIEWFKTLPTMFETEDYYFVHAGLDPEREPHETSIYSRLWIRGPFLRSDRMWDKMVVHGHSPVKEPEVKPNRINVNTRPRNTGYVSGARLTNDGSKKVDRFFRSETSTAY